MQPQTPLAYPPYVLMPSAPSPKKHNRLIVLLAVLAALLLFGVAPLIVLLVRENKADLERPARIQAMTIGACRTAVENELKSPATAQYSHESVLFDKNKPNVFLVSGSVDAQNGFGALVRNGYICTGVLTADNTAVGFVSGASLRDGASLYDLTPVASDMAPYRDRRGVCGLTYLSACWD